MNLFLSGEELSVVEREGQQEHERAKKRSCSTVCDSANKKQRR